MSAWTEFECLTRGSNGGCREHHNEPRYTNSTVLATCATIRFSIRGLLHGRRKGMNQTSWLTVLEKRHRSHTHKFSRLHLIHCPHFNTGVHGRYAGDCHGQSVYSSIWIKCTNWKAYYQGQTLIRNIHVNCLERFQLPRGNVTTVFWRHTRYIYATVLGNLLPYVLGGAT